MKQPYTYSMPESFLKDKSVPARWRILGVINGFILNGGCFYGSNEWLMEQLDCSEQTVSNAFAELESLGEIRVERTRRTRKVYKTSRDPSQLGSETQVGSSRDPSSFGTNSVSNSEKNISVAPLRTPPLEKTEVPDTDTDLERPSKLSKSDKDKLQLLIGWAERERGFSFLPTKIGKQRAALALAKENGIKAAQLKERWQEMAEQKFWKTNGFDWMNVVDSFNKKGV